MLHPFPRTSLVSNDVNAARPPDKNNNMSSIARPEKLENSSMQTQQRTSESSKLHNAVCRTEERKQHASKRVNALRKRNPLIKPSLSKHLHGSLGTQTSHSHANQSPRRLQAPATSPTNQAVNCGSDTKYTTRATLATPTRNC